MAVWFVLIPVSKRERQLCAIRHLPDEFICAARLVQTLTARPEKRIFTPRSVSSPNSVPIFLKIKIDRQNLKFSRIIGLPQICSEPNMHADTFMSSRYFYLLCYRPI